MTYISLPSIRTSLNYLVDNFIVRPCAKIKTCVGQAFWNLYTCLHYSSIIKREIQRAPISLKDLDQTIQNIFLQCRFKGTWRADAKISAIREAVHHRIQQEILPQQRLAARHAIFSPEYLPALIRDIDSYQEQDYQAKIIELEKKYPDSDGLQIRNLFLLKLKMGSLSDISIGEQSIRALLETPQGKKAAWAFLSQQEFDENETIGIINRHTPSLPKQAESPDEEKSPQDAQAPVETITEVEPPPANREFDLNRAHRQSLIDTIFKFCNDLGVPPLIPVIITKRIIPQNISSFRVYEKKSQTRFEIEYPSELSTRLGPKGQAFLKADIAISVKNKITGSIDANAIHFDENCITGTWKGVSGYISSLSKDPKNSNNLEVSVYKWPFTFRQSWDEEEFDSAFGDLSWPAFNAPQPHSAADRARISKQVARLEHGESSLSPSVNPR